MSSVKMNLMSYLYSNNIIKTRNSLFLHLLAQVTERAYMLSHVHPSAGLRVTDSPPMGQIWAQFHIRLIWKSFTKVQISLKIIQKYQLNSTISTTRTQSKINYHLHMYKKLKHKEWTKEIINAVQKDHKHKYSVSWICLIFLVYGLKCNADNYEF